MCFVLFYFVIEISFHLGNPKLLSIITVYFFCLFIICSYDVIFFLLDLFLDLFESKWLFEYKIR